MKKFFDALWVGIVLLFVCTAVATGLIELAGIGDYTALTLMAIIWVPAMIWLLTVKKQTFAKLKASALLCVVIGLVVLYLFGLNRDAVLLTIALCIPAVGWLWSATFRARTRDYVDTRRRRILNSFSRETWRLMPFYVAAILFSLAALRYLLTGWR